MLTTVPIAGQTFTCAAVRVWDGDGPIWCRNGVKVRLAGIAARELNGSCRRGQPCPAVSGAVARDALVNLLGGEKGRSRDGHVIVGGTTLQCRSAGDGRYGRIAAWCTGPGIGDLSCALVTRRVAVRWMRYDGASVCRSRGFTSY